MEGWRGVTTQLPSVYNEPTDTCSMTGRDSDVMYPTLELCERVGMCVC